jgi:hypothetical protein
VYWPQAAIKFFDFDVTATNPDGSPATLAGVDVALLAPGTTPDGTTSWTAAGYSGTTASVLLAGPAATGAPSNALAIPATVGGDLWARNVDNPEVDVRFVEPFRPF